jgi:release factor glutamine methyltransferase
MSPEPATPPPTIDGLLRSAARDLGPRSDSPRLDAELLLAHVMGVARVDLYRSLFAPVPAPTAAAFATVLAERVQGRPVAQLTGTKEFWTLALTVSRATLIPRPETELLVTRALELLPAGSTGPLLELGTGSGAVALALATERPGVRVVATDLSKPALTIARSNARRLGTKNIRFHVGDWYEALPAGVRFTVIVSNPPYVTSDELASGDAGLAFEPRLALLGGRDGLDAFRAIIAGAPARLLPQGSLLLEHGATQADSLRALLKTGGFTAIRTWQDLAGRPRCTEGLLA